MDEREYTLVDHLTDLRTRIVRAAIGVVVVALAAFAVSDSLLDLLRMPYENAARELGFDGARFVVIAPAEYFIAQLKAAFVAGIFLSSPWTLYQIWMFVAPGLYDHERRWSMGFIWAVAFFFVGGAVFAYTLVFPPMFKFFIQMTQDAQVEMTLSVAEHFSFSLKLLLAFGLVFQAPVIVFVLSMAGIVNPRELMKYRPHVIVAGFIIGAMLTPPDILSQTLLALPLVILFEGGLWASVLAIKLRGTPLKREKKGAAEPASEVAKSSVEATGPDEIGESVPAASDGDAGPDTLGEDAAGGTSVSER